MDALSTRHSAALAELERYRLLVDSVQDYAIFLLDCEGRVCTWNKGAERNKGYTAQEIIGRHFSAFYLEGDKLARKPERELELARRHGKVEDEDWRVRKDGSHFWANVVITALYDDTGELVGYAKVTRDLTERKQHEDALRRANTILKRQQKELELLNSYKDEFISLASHQLRTPATSTKQYLGLLLEGFLGEIEARHRDAIQKAYESNERQLGIVNSLLRVAQVDEGKVMLRRSSVDITRLLADVLEGYADKLRQRQQTAAVDAPLQSVEAVADARYLRMAIENLVDNASKYTPAGGKITLSAHADGGFVLVRIRDTGVGMSEEDTRKLFQKFVRLPNAMSDRVDGSGLGLYWVQRVIALHDGRVDVASVPGEGTVFTLYLPAGG